MQVKSNLEQSATLLTFIKLPFVIKNFAFVYLWVPIYTDFTEIHLKIGIYNY